MAVPPRGAGFGHAELSFLLEFLERIQPISQTEWKAVLAEHEQPFSQQGRTVDSLRRKFSTLHRRKMPTGDPKIPEEVLRAKKNPAGNDH